MGTLTVQNLQGPTSGANANKVIIPSGQTLEVTDNIRYDDMPSGSVIQMQNAGIAGNSNTTTSTSFICLEVAPFSTCIVNHSSTPFLFKNLFLFWK